MSACDPLRQAERRLKAHCLDRSRWDCSLAAGRWCPVARCREYPQVATALSSRAPRGTQMTLQQNGRSTSAKRLDDADFKRLEDAAAALSKKVKDQTALPGSEAAVRRIIEELRSGTPNYDLLGPNLAATVRQQLPQLKANMVQLGAVQSISFKGVGPAGADIYQVQFANGAIEFRIGLGPDGKIENAAMRPVQ